MHFNVIFSQKLADFALNNIDIHFVKPGLFKMMYIIAHVDYGCC